MRDAGNEVEANHLVQVSLVFFFAARKKERTPDLRSDILNSLEYNNPIGLRLIARGQQRIFVLLL